MKMIKVSSSAISAIGYDSSTSTMRIVFIESGPYDYHSVPEHIFTAFLQSNSKGAYYNDHIRDHY